MTFLLTYLYLGSVLMSLVVLKSAGIDMSSPVSWIYSVVLPVTWPVFFIWALRGR